MEPRERQRPTVYLHIGPAKTGTSFIQTTLKHLDHSLREVGIVSPGGGQTAHFRAALDLRGELTTGMGPAGRATRLRACGGWDRLVSATLSVDSTAIISSEWFAHADADQAAKAVRDLRIADLHLIVTARDPERQLVSIFQQQVKEGAVHTWKARQPSTQQSAVFRPSQRLDELLDRWGGSLEPDHVHVVTVPPSGSAQDVLWGRFARVVGIDPLRFCPSPNRVNETLGIAEVELLRRVNAALSGRIPHPIYDRIVKSVYANEILAGSATATKPAAPESMWPLLDQIADQWIEAIKSADYDLSGDLADLRPVHRAGRAPGSATAKEVAETAVHATAELLIELAALKSGRAKAGSRQRPDRVRRNR